MAAELSFNKKMDVFKLIMSSLFARRQDWLVFNGDELNTFMFSNIPIERVTFYRSDIDDTLARVKITDKAAGIIYELFPFLREACGIINMSMFLSTINKLVAKTKGVAPKVYLKKETGTIEMDPIADAEQLFTSDADTTIPNTVIGHLLTDDVYEAYKKILENFQKYTFETVDLDITIPSACSKDLVVVSSVELHNSVHDKDATLKFPVQDGTNVVSFKEYLTKRKAPWNVHATIQYNEKRGAAKVMLSYRDDLVDVVSISPGSLWFPFLKK